MTPIPHPNGRTTESSFSDEEIKRLRNETPGCEKVIHLNNAGAALMPMSVSKTIRAHLDLESEMGGYEAADHQADAIADVYVSIAQLLKTDARNIALVENATAAYGQALSSIPWREGDIILTTLCDYVSNQLMFLSLQKRFGIQIIRAPDTSEGGVDVAAMEDLVRKHRPKLVAVTHVPTNSGLVQDVESIGSLCKEADVLYLVDACQSAGQLPLDTGSIQCDFLTASSRKFLRGPRGTGFLYVSERILEEGLEPLMIDLRGAEWTSDDVYHPVNSARRFENFEFSFANVLGMGAAVRHALELGIEQIQNRSSWLAGKCRSSLETLNGVRLLDQGKSLASIVTIDLKHHQASSIVSKLREEGINTSMSPRKYGVIDFDRKGVAEGALRISPHYYNLSSEIDRLIQVLGKMLER